MDRYDTSERYTIRPLSFSDFNRGYHELMSQLTVVEDITRKKFANFCQYLDMAIYHDVYVIHDKKTDKIIGSATLLVEPKFIHGCAKLAHIEDVVIDEEHKKMGLGSWLLSYIIEQARTHHCYKIRLISRDQVTRFYERLGFVKDQVGMMMVL